jgi:hypothetical protein
MSNMCQLLTRYSFVCVGFIEYVTLYARFYMRDIYQIDTNDFYDFERFKTAKAFGLIYENTFRSRNTRIISLPARYKLVGY